MKFSPTLLAAAGLAVCSLPAHAYDDRLTLRAGVTKAKAETEISGETVFMDEPYSYSEDFDFGSDELVPRLDGAFRLGGRHRLVFHYFRYDKDRRETLDEGISYDGVTIPAGSFAEVGAKFHFAGLLYDFAVVDTPSLNLGLQIGAEWAKAEGSLRAEAGEYRYDEDASESGYAPTVGLRLTATPSERWLIDLQGQYLDADWGDFGDYDGSFTRAHALAEYRFTDNFGVFAGYEWYRLDVERRIDDDGIVGWDQRFHGPVAGVTFAF